MAKTRSAISLRQVKSIGDFHQLQFNMLGNEFESIFLPSAIVIVEGDSDVSFIAKATKLHIPDRKVAIVRAGGDGEVRAKLNVLKETFGEIETSPYRDRLFVVLDKEHSARVSRIQGQGVPRDNIIVWVRNGIEYLYPPALVAEVFHCDVAELVKCNFESDPIGFNGIARSKKELAQVISEGMTQSDLVHSELAALLGRIRAACK